jgi:uncharacterized cupin superfamily protein
MQTVSIAWRYIFAALFLAVSVTVLPHESRADEGPWTVSEISGEVRVMPLGGRAVALSAGDIVPAGAEVETAVAARLVLTRGESSITVAPASRLSLAEEPGAGLTTTIVQQLGTLLLRVNRKPQQHFEVRTPFLAAVVKGTTFTVSVDADGAAVHVVEGLVEVNDIDTGQTALVRPGQTATTSSEAGSGLSVGDGGGSNGTPDQRGAVEPEEDDASPGKSEDAPGQIKKAEAETDAASTKAKSNNGKAVGLAIKQALNVETADVSSLTDGLVTSSSTPTAGVGANGNGQGNAFGAANGNSGVGALVSQNAGSGNNGNGNAGNSGNGNGNNGNNGNGNSGNGNSGNGNNNGAGNNNNNGNGNSGNNGNGNGNNNGSGNNGNGNNGNNGNGNGNS